MKNTQNQSNINANGNIPTKEKLRETLSSISKRALEEAQRRHAAQKNIPKPPVEIGGRKGPDPSRFGDWEKNGLSIDF
ncbi:DUF1674 domain-containing protein [Candidatus Liberibacter sp.]|uniref:DUF1674 domain-containing protein n=1 Tax=Candidatus Liberibacter sp. TaxID=34022 RepID=UPI0015F5FDE4|nr:DUF1674 domain-containing protein [Candidatus Liberibacter sp.]MBA5724416.1 DUF1674 domain-containing protein [Candidatus Liberibacter sp.]